MYPQATAADLPLHADPPTLLTAHAQARILIVAGSQDHITLLRRVLTRHGLTQIEAETDPLEAVERLPDLDPDLVLLDLHTPCFDGPTLIRSLRARSGRRYLPVVILTGAALSEAVLRALQDEATDYVTTPLHALEIAVRVRNLLFTRSLHQILQVGLETRSQTRQAILA